MANVFIAMYNFGRDREDYSSLDAERLKDWIINGSRQEIK